MCHSEGYANANNYHNADGNDNDNYIPSVILHMAKPFIIFLVVMWDRNEDVLQVWK